MKPVDLAMYKKAEFDEDVPNVKVLQSVQAAECNGHDNYLNVYLVIDLHTGDSLYVFQQCSKIPMFATAEYKSNDLLDIEIIKRELTSGYIYIPSAVELTPKFKYIVADLKQISL
jgi:hypothetical protein